MARQGTQLRGHSKWSGSTGILLLTVGVLGSSLYLGYAIGNVFMPTTNTSPDKDVVLYSSKINYSLFYTHNLTISFAGGLGSQMFQYAALYGIAKANGLLPVVSAVASENTLVLSIFPHLTTLKSPESNPGYYYPKFREHRGHAFDSRTYSLNYLKNIELIGHYQSWRYFDNVRTEIRKQFEFSTKVIEIVHAFLHRSVPKDKKGPFDFIGVHIRRGDFLAKENTQYGYSVPDIRFFKSVVFYFNSKKPSKHLVFVVTSDDIQWCKDNLDLEDTTFVYSDLAHPGLDMALLSQCNHSVITAGAFGWWGAWLAGRGETVYYRGFPKVASQLERDFGRTDYYLPQWVPI